MGHYCQAQLPFSYAYIPIYHIYLGSSTIAIVLACTYLCTVQLRVFNFGLTLAITVFPGVQSLWGTLPGRRVSVIQFTASTETCTASTSLVSVAVNILRSQCIHTVCYLTRNITQNNDEQSYLQSNQDFWLCQALGQCILCVKFVHWLSYMTLYADFRPQAIKIILRILLERESWCQ